MAYNLDSLIRKNDSENMLDLILNFPDQVRKAVQIAEAAEIPKPEGPIDHVLVAGMGGSAIGGNLLEDFFAASGTFPCTVVRDYNLPGWISENVFVVLCSYSGNTEETLSAYHSALQRGSRCIVCTSNGQLFDEARQNGHTVIQIPGGQPPRTALGYLFFPFLRIFLNWNWIGSDLVDFRELYDLLESIRSANNPNHNETSPAMEIAEFCTGRIPVLYSSPQLHTVAMRWKGQFCENSKSLAYHNVLPEMNHNEIIGWQRAKEMGLHDRIGVMFLRDKDDHIRVQKRMEITKELIAESGTPTLDIQARGNSLLARIFSLIYLADFVSFNLAMLNGENPTTIRNIDYLKSVLSG